MEAAAIRRGCRIWQMSDSGSRVIWEKRPPGAVYADTVARMMVMVGAHESKGFLCDRQEGFEGRAKGGAFGIFQVEEPGIEFAMSRLRGSSFLWARVCDWLGWWGELPPGPYESVPALISDGQHDALAVAVMRAYHWGNNDTIPWDPLGMSEYCKKRHNWNGRATPRMYLEAWERWAPAIGIQERRAV